MLFLAILIMIGFTIAVCYMVPKINELRLELQKKDISISYLEQNKSTIKEEVDYLIKRKIKLTSDIEDYEDKILSIENGFREDIGEDHFTVSDHNVHINMIKTSLKSRVKSDLAVDLESVWSLNESTNQSIKKLIVNVFNTACDNVLLRNKGNQLDDIKSIIENERKNVERISPDGFKFFDNYVSDKIEEILLIVQRERKKKNREFDDVVEKGREHIKELEDDVSEKKRSLNRLKKSYKGLSDDVKDEIDAEIRLLEEKLSELLKTLDEEKEVFIVIIK